ncbi:MAG: HIT family protein [Dehalococcoidales bacterium]|jgi:histidine triad (HIT) family protein
MAERDWVCEDLLTGKMKVDVIWEDKRALSFLAEPDPRFKMHAIIVPKKHVSYVTDPEAIDGKALESMMLAVQKTAAALGVDKTGFYVRFNAAFPEVTPHIHWHLISVEPKP